jgi:hypothetical protein
MVNYNDNIIWSKAVDAIFKEKGIPLFDIIDNNWAFTKENILDVVEKLKEIQIPILGGDVFVKRKGMIRFGNANWYCNKSDTPEGKMFLDFSIEKSKQYILHVLNYNATNKKEEVLFSIVPQVKNDDKNNIEIIKLIRW